MFFKTNLCQAVVVTVSLVMFLVGCNTKVGEAPPPQTTQEFGGTRCLSEATPVAKAFVQGKANNEELAEAWDCLSGAVEKFKRYVRGRSANRYTSQELATFLENNFLEQNSNRKISPALQTELMKLKMVFVGGRVEDITRSEIDRLLVLFGNLRSMTLALNPYMQVLSLNWVVSHSSGLQAEVRYFEDANRELQNAAKSLASLIESNGATYKLSDFVALTENLSIFFGEKWTFPKAIAKYMPVVKKVKKALAGGDENSIAPTEWRRFALLGARGYIQFLRYHYFIKTVPETGGGYRLSYLSRTVEDIFSVLQDLVAEKPEGVVSRAEIFDLLGTLQAVWPEFKVSEGLVYEIMKVKTLLLGGSADSFTTVDFGNARLKVGRVKILVERFLPYYSIFSGEWEPDLYQAAEAQKLFMESQLVFESTAREVGLLFEGAYDLNDIASLAREVEYLYPQRDGDSLESKIKRVLPLIKDLKSMILGGNDAVLMRGQWSVVLSFSARAYTDFLYYRYFLKDQPSDKSRTFESLSVFVNQSLNILRDILSTKQEKQFSRAEIGRIAQHLISLELLPEGIKLSSLDQALGLVLNNILVPPQVRLDGNVPNAFTLSSIEVARQEAQIWLDSEIYITRLAEGWGPSEGLTGKEFIEELLRAQSEASASSYLLTALKEFLLTAQTSYPITVDIEGRVHITSKSYPLYTARSLRQLNINRALSRTLIRSFVGSKERLATNAGVNLTEVESVYVTIKPLLVELGLINQSNTSFASSRFREANIFVPHSDGNSLTSYQELTDLVGMIWSGLNVNSMLRKELIRVCFRGIDQSDNAVVSLSCARRAYRQAMPNVMSATPDYVRFMLTSSREEWAFYMNNIFRAAGYVPNEKELAKLEDIALAPHVIQYVEMIFARFDANKDGVISTSDSLRAFPAFKGILLELASNEIASGTIKEKDLLDLFTYILRYGKPPVTLREQIRFVLRWKGKPELWDVWADRTQLSQILGYIADEVNRKSKAMVVGQAQGISPRSSESPLEPRSLWNFAESGQ